MFRVQNFEFDSILNFILVLAETCALFSVNVITELKLNLQILINKACILNTGLK